MSSHPLTLSQAIITLARLQKELARLERNKERRQAREKQKGIFPTDGADEVAEVASPGTPASGGAQKNMGGTSRKCANCGQVGHIKTNKKYDHLLATSRNFSHSINTSSARSSIPHNLSLHVEIRS